MNIVRRATPHAKGERMKQLLSILAICLSAIPTPALGFTAPDNAQTTGNVHAMRTTTVDGQQAIAQEIGFDNFVRNEGFGWRATFDEVSHTPHRMWGPGIDLGPVNTEAEATQGILDFVARNARLLGVDERTYGIKSANYVARVNTWYIDVDTFEDELPIFEGTLTARIKHGRLIMFGSDTYPNVNSTGSATLSKAEAVTIATTAGAANDAPHTIIQADLVSLPIRGAEETTLIPTWIVRSDTEKPVGQWKTFIHAQSGKIIAIENLVRFSIMEGSHPERTIGDSDVVSPLPFLYVTDGSATTTTDENGLFVLDQNNREAALEGPYLEVRNQDGPEADASFSGDGFFDEDNATQAEISSYVFIHHVRDWAEGVAPEVYMSIAEIRSNVNEDGACNAYFNGDVTFYRAGSGCNNTALIADVNYHEWGHGFHYYSIQSGGYDGSLGEGAADVISFTLTGDPEVGPGFFTNGAGIREHETNKVYPEDYVNDDSYVHSNGLIFGGAMWDLWQILQAELGEEEGTHQMEQIFSGLLKGGPDVESSYYEAIVADDDDGDLGNGTPNYCAINEAFDQHGLGPGDDGVLIMDHDPITLAMADTPIPIQISFEELACSSGNLDDAVVYWRTGGADWQTTSLSLVGEGAEASIPSQPLGSIVEYFINISSDSGGSFYAPEGGEITPYTIIVGDIITLTCIDFEDSDGGFTHDLIGGEWSEGADDWQWGSPNGAAGDPTSAWSGSEIWGNDLGDDNYNGEYQNEKHNRLSAPAVALSHYEDIWLHYRRWLTIEDGYFDQASIRANGIGVWSNWDSASSSAEEHHLDSEWMSHAVPLYLDGETVAEIDFDLVSDEGLAFGGWNIDDFCVVVPATPDNRLGINGFTASDDDTASSVSVSFINPKHAPVERVVVVRSETALPTDISSGVIIYDDNAPVLGKTVSFEDQEPTATVYYAAYAFDGTDWLSWTRQGFNADTGTASGSGIPETPDNDGIGLGKGSCGCDASATPSLTWLLLLVVPFLRRRQTV
jgi:hypothetical protein